MQTQVNTGKHGIRVGFRGGVVEWWWAARRSLGSEKVAFHYTYLIDQPIEFVNEGRVRLEVLVAKLDKLFSLERFGELLSIQVTKQYGYVRPLGGQRRLLAYKPLQHSTIYRAFERSHEVVPCCGFIQERDERFMETLEDPLLFN